MALNIQRPLTDSFRLAYAGDPALDHSLPDFDARYERCVQRLDFAELIKPGEQPTWFWFAPLSISQVRKLLDVATGNRHFWLAVRMSLRRLEGGGDVVVERATDNEYPKLGELVTVALMDSLEALPQQLGRPAFELVNDFGAAILARAMGPLPK